MYCTWSQKRPGIDPNNTFPYGYRLSQQLDDLVIHIITGALYPYTYVNNWRINEDGEWIVRPVGVIHHGSGAIDKGNQCDNLVHDTSTVYLHKTNTHGHTLGCIQISRFRHKKKQAASIRCSALQFWIQCSI